MKNKDGQPLTDQTGRFTSHTIAPGRSRGKFQEVDAAPNGSAQVSLTPVTIE